MNAKRKTVMLVDDNLSNLTTGKNLLKDHYEVYPVPSALRMFDLLAKVTPDLILLDIEMADMNGYQAIVKLKADRRLSGIPVIFLTSKTDEVSEMRGFQLGAADYIFKPYSPPILMQRIANQLLIVQQKEIIKRRAEELAQVVANKDLEVFRLQNAIIRALANLSEMRDEYSNGHIQRVQSYVEALLIGLMKTKRYAEEISAWNMELILPSVQPYDIGKIGIPDAILQKQGELDSYEMEIIKTHVDIGVKALKKVISDTAESDFLNRALNIASYHHEKWDGSGYPNGLRGTEIPLEARMTSIADVYDALISKRPYKKAYSHPDAVKIIKAGAGTHFDPILVQVFSIIEQQFYEISL